MEEGEFWMRGMLRVGKSNSGAGSMIPPHLILTLRPSWEMIFERFLSRAVEGLAL